MANHLPIKLHNNELQRFQSGDTVAIEHGGTGATTAAGARAALGLGIGTDVMPFSTSLDSLQSLATGGHVVWTGTAFVPRDIASASPARVTVANGSGVNGNTVIDLATVGTAASSGLYKFSTDAYGRVTATTAVTAADINTLIGSTYVKVDGSTAMTAPLTLGGVPSNANHAVSKSYVDNLFSSGGIPPFEAVRARTTTNINLNSPGATHDGVSMAVNDRLLVASQTDGKQNGIYVWSGAAQPLTRASDADISDEFAPARQVFVQAGTTYANTGWAVGNSTKPVIGTDPISFTQVSGATSYTAGNGLSLTGNVFAAKVVANQLVATGTGIGLATSGVTAGTYTKVTVDQYGRVTAAVAATAADVGAQPASEALTAIAGVSTQGIMARTGANTYAARTITGTSGRVSVTNGNGASGNPTIDLVATGVAAGTYNSVTVDQYGRVTAGANSQSNSNVEQMVNGEASQMVAMTAVYISGNGQVKRANANNITTAKVVGFADGAGGAASAAVNIVVDGIVTGTTGQWDARTGQSGGLTPGAEYFLSNTTAGNITTTAPESGIHAPVGIAISPTKLKIDIKRVVIL